MLIEKMKKVNSLYFKKDYEYKPDTYEGTKAVKQHKKDNLKITLDNIVLDADLRSQVYLASILSLANFTFIQTVAGGTSLSDAYNAVYKQLLNWKDANNEIQDIDVETIAAALKTTMEKLAKIIGVNNT